MIYDCKQARFYFSELHIRIIPNTQSEEAQKLGLSKLGMVLTVNEESEVVLERNALLGSPEIGSYPPPDISFQLEASPKNGHLLLNGVDTMNFSWKDVEERAVSYTSKKKVEGGNALFDDDLSFQIVSATDQWVLRDKIIDHLEIQVLLTPKISLTTAGKPFSVVEGESALITEENLVVPPQNRRASCSLIAPPLHGHIYDVVRQIAVSGFSNTDIIQHQIYYQQNKHKEVEPRSDLIRLNCMGSMVDLPVTITAENDEIPAIISENIVLSPDELVPLDRFVKIEDPDIPTENILVDVLKFPSYGTIFRNATEEDPNAIQTEPLFQPVRHFSAKDLSQPGRILYRHDGSDSLLDDFVLRASDGVHTVEKTIHINVNSVEVPLDDDSSYGVMEIVSSPVELVGPETEIQFYNSSNVTTFFNQTFRTDLTSTGAPMVRRDMPNITINELHGPLVNLPNKHLGVILTPEAIKIERISTSTDKELLFEILDQPRFGSFVDFREPERSVHVFPESSLETKMLAYALYPSASQPTEDHFTLQAINEFGGRTRSLRGVIRWAWITFSREKYEVSEFMGVVKIGVLRKGWLQSKKEVSVHKILSLLIFGTDLEERYKHYT